MFALAKVCMTIIFVCRVVNLPSKVKWIDNIGTILEIMVPNP